MFCDLSRSYTRDASSQKVTEKGPIFFSWISVGYNKGWGFPDGSDSEESACNAGDLGLIPKLGDPLKEARQPTPVFFPGESHGQRILTGYSPWGHKESDTPE